MELREKKTSWIRFPLLKDLVLESKQRLGPGRPRCVEKNGGTISDVIRAKDKKTYEQNAWGEKWTVLKEEKFGESSGAPAGHGPSTVTQTAY